MKLIVSVRGLRAGREFALVLRAAADEGVGPPVVLTAFTLTDNAQTVIGKETNVKGSLIIQLTFYDFKTFWEL